MPGEVSSWSTTSIDRETLEPFAEFRLTLFDFREAKIENLRLLARRDKNIGRLHVAMHDAFGVRGFQRVGDLNRQRQQLIDGERAGAHYFGERLALQQLHDDEMLAIVLLDGVNRANVRVIQRGCGASFALEAFEQLRVLRHFIGEKLQCDLPAKPRIFGLVDHAHAAAA